MLSPVGKKMLRGAEMLECGWILSTPVRNRGGAVTTLPSDRKPIRRCIEGTKRGPTAQTAIRSVP